MSCNNTHPISKFCNYNQDGKCKFILEEIEKNLPCKNPANLMGGVKIRKKVVSGLLSMDESLAYMSYCRIYNNNDKPFDILQFLFENKERTIRITFEILEFEGEPK